MLPVATRVHAVDRHFETRPHACNTIAQNSLSRSLIRFYIATQPRRHAPSPAPFCSSSSSNWYRLRHAAGCCFRRWRPPETRRWSGDRLPPGAGQLEVDDFGTACSVLRPASCVGETPSSDARRNATHGGIDCICIVVMRQQLAAWGVGDARDWRGSWGGCRQLLESATATFTCTPARV